MSEKDNWSDSNQLSGSESPYLEQHANNPVHWLPWSSRAFDEAKRLDRPVLVSIGYSTCHWCHVMARESFENPESASLMNTILIPIKVDREQHPEVDAIYMEAAQRLNGGAGWPLNVFTTPEGRPFLALTYLPTGRWNHLLTQVSHLWTTDRERIDEVASALAVQDSSNRFSDEINSSAWAGALRADVRKNYDSDNPGFAAGGASMKFPPSQILDWLLEYGDNTDTEIALNILTTMMDSGLHDRVGGGFHRYSVDSGWRVPHFEKMAYDNAQLMGLYARASMLVSSSVGDEALSADLLAAAKGTADWFIREMRALSSSGRFTGYATATDADDPLGEGSYFAWPPAALNEILGIENGTWISTLWNISGDGQLPPPSAANSDRPHSGEYKPVPEWIPHPRSAAGYPESYRGGSDHIQRRSRELSIIEKLRTARHNRPAPARDRKVLTDQNALVLEGFTRLARYGGGQIYQNAAIELANLLISRSNRLPVSTAAGQAPKNPPLLKRSETSAAYITDYAYLSMALAGAYSLSGNPLYAENAESIAEEAVELLAVGDGSFYTTPPGRMDLFKRAIEDFDGPSPAGSHALGIAFNRLYAITGRRKWAERRDALLHSRGRLIETAPSFASSLIRVASSGFNPHTLVVAGPENHPKTQELLALCRRMAGPDTMVIAADAAGSSNLSDTPYSDNAGLAAAEYTASERPDTCLASPVDWLELEGRIGLKRPQLLVCREGNCLLPAFTLDEARARLAEI